MRFVNSGKLEIDKDKSINFLLIAEGQAVVYQQYINACTETKNQYLQLEQKAGSGIEVVIFNAQSLVR